MTSESAQQEDIATICKGLVDDHIQFVRKHRPALAMFMDGWPLL